MGVLVKALDALLPFRKPAKQQLQSAADGAQWMREGVKKLRRARAATDEAPPKSIVEARERFIAAAERYGRNDVESLRIIETDLARRHLVSIVAALISLALGIAGIILIVADGFWSGIGLSLGVPMAGYAAASALRYGLRRYQVKHRALVTLPVYIHAAGGWWAAIVFGAAEK